MVTTSWVQCVNPSIVRIYIVDTYNVANQYLSYEKTSHVLLCDFSEEMINKDLDPRPTRPKSNRNLKSASLFPAMKYVAAHLYKKEKKEHYRMVYEIPTISKSG